MFKLVVIGKGFGVFCVLFSVICEGVSIFCILDVVEWFGYEGKKDN